MWRFTHVKKLRSYQIYGFSFPIFLSYRLCVFFWVSFIYSTGVVEASIDAMSTKIDLSLSRPNRIYRPSVRVSLFFLPIFRNGLKLEWLTMDFMCPYRSLLKAKSWWSLHLPFLTMEFAWPSTAQSTSRFFNFSNHFICCQISRYHSFMGLFFSLFSSSFLFEGSRRIGRSHRVLLWCCQANYHPVRLFLFCLLMIVIWLWY